MDFSTTLTSDVGAADLSLNVASNDGARLVYPWRAVIEAETVYVMGGADSLTWNVRRGADDTDPAAHPAGSVLTAVRVGQSVIEALTEDGAASVILTTEDGTDPLTSDPTITGI